MRRFRRYFPSAILSCEIKLGGKFYVTGFNSFCGPQEESTIVSYVNEIKIEWGALINGQVEGVQSCALPFDLASALYEASQSNNNSVIPSKFLKDGKLKLENNDELTLPEGVYYFKEAKVGGKAVLRAEGEVLVFVQEDFKIEGQAKVNPEGNPLFRIISGKGVKIEGKSEIWGGIFGKEIKVGGTASANICVWSEEFKGEGKASLKCDRVLGLKEVKVYPHEVTIRVGESYQFSATAYDSRGKELRCAPISWLSENPQVATVTETGLAEGVSQGDTYIIASVLYVEGMGLVHVIVQASVAYLVDGGAEHTCAIKTDSSLWCWGMNEFGQLGDWKVGNDICYPGYPFSCVKLPKQITTEILQISAGDFHTCAIKTDGSLWCWGLNMQGQLGDGTIESKSTPVQIMTGVSQVSAGGAHTCAIKNDGSLWCWGYNFLGQVGDGMIGNDLCPIPFQQPQPCVKSPKQIMTGVLQVSAGNNHTCAIRTDGSLWCWGWGNALVRPGNELTPVQIIPSGVSQVSAGEFHTCVIKSDNSLWCWGQNFGGQLGDGTTMEKSTPTQIMVDVLQVSSGYSHTCAVKTDNSLWCWGWSYVGQVGDGTVGYKLSPIQIMTDVSQLSVGDYHSCAIKTDGSLWCWGGNWFGQIGDGTTEHRLSPVRALLDR